MYGPRGTQVSRTLAELPAHGWRPTVVALEARRREKDAPAAPPAGVDLLRVRSPDDWLLVRAVRRIAPALRDYPDPARLWVPRAARAAIRAARRRPFAGLITFAQPWSDHLVGLRVHRRTKLPWVAHFSDPWSDSPYADARQRAIWRPMEEEVVRAATAVVFVSDETADLVMRKYPAAWRAKASVVPHGFVRPAAPPGPPPPPARAMQVLYTGRFYRGVRTPIALLRALVTLDRVATLRDLVHVTFIGPHVEEYGADARELGIDMLTTFRGREPGAEIDRAAERADVLLVIDAPSDGPSVFLPSKLIDYLAYRKPILGITPADGASAALLRRIGAHVAPPDDETAIAAALEDLIARWRAGTLEVSSSFDAAAAEYDIRSTTTRLAAVLQRAFGV